MSCNFSLVQVQKYYQQNVLKSYFLCKIVSFRVLEYYLFDCIIYTDALTCE